MKALFVLTPSESKRLIGKAVASLPEVKNARKSDCLLVSHGSTNVYVAEEIVGKEETAVLFDRNTFLSGLIVRGTLCTTYAKEKGPILLMKNGKIKIRIDHWLHHNDEHVQEYRKWAARLEAENLAEAAVSIRRAADLIERSNEHFLAAKSKLEQRR